MEHSFFWVEEAETAQVSLSFLIKSDITTRQSHLHTCVQREKKRGEGTRLSFSHKNLLCYFWMWEFIEITYVGDLI